MKIPPNFKKALYHHVDSWRSNYHWWHPYDSKRKWEGKHMVVGTFTSLDNLELTLKQDRWDAYQQYISQFSYRLIKPNNKYVNNCQCDTASAIVNKIYGDLD